VPAYALFTNEQLAAMVTRRTRSLEALGAIDGVGKSRVEKYGPAFLAILAAAPVTQSDSVDAPSADRTP
jgi:superfamily II DNA helicase RecQ